MTPPPPSNSELEQMMFTIADRLLHNCRRRSGRAICGSVDLVLDRLKYDEKIRLLQRKRDTLKSVLKKILQIKGQNHAHNCKNCGHNRQNRCHSKLFHNEATLESVRILPQARQLHTCQLQHRWVQIILPLDIPADWIHRDYTLSKETLKTHIFWVVNL